MLLKVAIVVLFIALVVSLFSGLFFLAKDQGSSRRTLNSLGLRVVLAGALLLLIGYGVISGKLASQAPWAARPAAQSDQP